MDGISLAPALDGKNVERPGYLTVGYMRLVRGEDGIALIRNRFKLLRTRTATKFELYDLENDPAETTDLASETAIIEAVGNGRASIWVGNDLTVRASGTSSLEYWGAPEVDQQVSDLASVVALGPKDD